LTGFLVPRQKASPFPHAGTLVKVINRNCFGKRLKGWTGWKRWGAARWSL